MKLLGSYEERLLAMGMPVAEWVRPGLTAEEIEEAVEPLGIRLPKEGRVWWEWHDGAIGRGRDRLLGPSKECLTLASAVEVYQRCRWVAEQTASAWPQNDPDFLWNPAWFPVEGSQLPTVIDCSIPEDQISPVRSIDWQDVDGFFEPQAESLGQMVSWWIDAIDIGAWEWNQGDQRWYSHDDRLEPALRAHPLM
jgi:cell wall assembly regulator SMI1